MYDVRINLKSDSGPEPESPQYYPPYLSLRRKPENQNFHSISVVPAKTQSLIKLSNFYPSTKKPEPSQSCTAGIKLKV